MATLKKNHVSVPEWMIKHNLLEANPDKDQIRAAVSWFKRNLDVTVVLSPKAGIYLTDETAANAALDEYMKLVPGITKIKQRAALKLCAKNVGLSIAKRAGLMPDETTKQQRKAFWLTAIGQALFQYQVTRLYTQKTELIPPNYEFMVPSLETALSTAMTPEETINPTLLKAATKVTRKSATSQSSNLRATRTIEKANLREQLANASFEEAEAESILTAEGSEETAEDTQTTPEATPPAAAPNPPAASRKGGSR